MHGEYKLEKWIWSDQDFDSMGWHDATIHALTFGPNPFEISFDIDYIFKWVHPEDDEIYFKFWVSPCTLVFQNVHGLKFEMESYGEPTPSIGELERSNPRKPKNAEHIQRDTEYEWFLGCHHGAISFWSVGFKQYVRREPILRSSQSLDLDERGGISFATGK